MFIAALFTITKIQNQPKCPSVDKYTKQQGYIYTMELLRHKKRRKFYFGTAWVDLEIIMLSEIGQRKISTILFHSYVKFNEQTELINKIERS